MNVVRFGEAPACASSPTAGAIGELGHGRPRYFCLSLTPLAACSMTFATASGFETYTAWLPA
ncbi:hypothetical protein ACVIF9_007031 [Bradyrhizobium sp. USDA 4350]